MDTHFCGSRGWHKIIGKLLGKMFKKIFKKCSFSQLCAAQNFLLRRQSRKKKMLRFPPQFCVPNLNAGNNLGGKERGDSQVKGSPSPQHGALRMVHHQRTVEQQEKMLLTQHEGGKAGCESIY